MTTPPSRVLPVALHHRVNPSLRTDLKTALEEPPIKWPLPVWLRYKVAAARSPASTPVVATSLPGPTIDNKFNFLAILQSNIYECALDEKKRENVPVTVMNVLDKSEDTAVVSCGKAKKNKVIAAVIVFQQTSTNRLNRKDQAR